LDFLGYMLRSFQEEDFRCQVSGNREVVKSGDREAGRSWSSEVGKFGNRISPSHCITASLPKGI